MSRYPGSNAVVYMGTTAGTAAVNVPNLTQFGLQTPQDLVDLTACNDTNKIYGKTNIPDTKGSFDVWFDDTNTAALFTAAAQTSGVNMYLYPTRVAPGKYFYGLAWAVVTNFQSGGINGGVKATVNWAAAGAWANTL